MRGSDEGVSTDLRQLIVLHEDMRGDIKGILEAVKATQQMTARIPKMEADIESITDDIRAFKAALRETNQDLHRLENRVDQLEAAV